MWTRQITDESLPGRNQPCPSSTKRHILLDIPHGGDSQRNSDGCALQSGGVWCPRLATEQLGESSAGCKIYQNVWTFVEEMKVYATLLEVEQGVYSPATTPDSGQEHRKAGKKAGCNSRFDAQASEQKDELNSTMAYHKTNVRLSLHEVGLSPKLHVSLLVGPIATHIGNLTGTAWEQQPICTEKWCFSFSTEHSGEETQLTTIMQGAESMRKAATRILDMTGRPSSRVGRSSGGLEVADTNERPTRGGLPGQRRSRRDPRHGL